MRRAAIASAAAIAALVASLVGGGATSAGLTFTAETPDDVRAVASAAWTRFLDAFPASRTCMGTVTLDGVWALDDRADYDDATATIRLRLPGTAANLEATLLHELGHRYDAACPGALDRHESFLRAAGLPRTTAWTRGATWASTPAERYAEAVARVVLGAPPPHVLIDVSPAEVDAVRATAE